MKIAPVVITLFSAGCIAVSSIAQSVAKKGFVILNNGDTLQGWIKYYNWGKKPSSVEFLNDSLNNKATTYSKFDIRGFEVIARDRYIREVVQKDMRSMKIGELQPATVELLVTNTVLLRVLVKGSKFDLYELINSNPHYFIKRFDGDIKELSYKLISDDNIRYKEPISTS